MKVCCLKGNVSAYYSIFLKFSQQQFVACFPTQVVTHHMMTDAVVDIVSYYFFFYTFFWYAMTGIVEMGRKESESDGFCPIAAEIKTCFGG